jgi:hypothetical protein
MKVSINAGGREVTIECDDTNTSPKDVAAETLAVWQATAGAHGGEGAAYGFSSERRASHTTSAFAMNHGGQPTAPEVVR